MNGLRRQRFPYSSVPSHDSGHAWRCGERIDYLANNTIPPQLKEHSRLNIPTFTKVFADPRFPLIQIQKFDGCHDFHLPRADKGGVRQLVIVLAVRSKTEDSERNDCAKHEVGLGLGSSTK